VIDGVITCRDASVSESLFIFGCLYCRLDHQRQPQLIEYLVEENRALPEQIGNRRLHCMLKMPLPTMWGVETDRRACVWLS
jgi:hypothetical protein